MIDECFIKLIYFELVVALSYSFISSFSIFLSQVLLFKIETIKLRILLLHNRWK